MECERELNIMFPAAESEAADKESIICGERYCNAQFLAGTLVMGECMLDIPANPNYGEPLLDDTSE